MGSKKARVIHICKVLRDQAIELEKSSSRIIFSGFEGGNWKWQVDNILVLI